MTTTLVGFATERRHYGKTDDNSYPGPIPVEDVRSRLFNWQAQESPIHVAAAPLDNFVEVPGWKAIVRSDTLETLAVHRTSYQCHQYDESLLDNIAHLLDDGGLKIGRAGTLRNGAAAYVQIELPDTITAPGGFEFRPYLLGASSHDGSLSLTYRTMVNALICDNQLSASLYGGSAGVRIRHTRHSTLRLMEARNALGIVLAVADDFSAQVAKLTAEKISVPKWDRFVEVFVPIDEDAKPGAALTRAENKRATLHRLWNSDERVAPWKGTAWGVIQAVNTWAHHEQAARGDRAERNMSRAVYGEVDSLDRRTLATLEEVTA